MSANISRTTYNRTVFEIALSKKSVILLLHCHSS